MSIDKLKNWFEEKLFWVKTGYRLEIANDGKPVNPIVIRYKDIYFEIMLDAGTDDPTGSFGWSRDPGMSHVPIREHYVAKRGTNTQEEAS